MRGVPGTIGRSSITAATLVAVLTAPGAAAAAPPPGAPIPSGPVALARELTQTVRDLRAANERWRESGLRSARAPRDAELLALHHQRIFRVLGRDPRLARRVLARLPEDVRGEARDTVRARAALRRIPSGGGRPARLRTQRPRSPGALLSYYRAAQRRFGVRWTLLAAINLVETNFGRIASHSSAGARGPMQFIPSTWRAYGMGGDVHDPRDAVMGAANYLRASGAPRNERRALYAYNHSRHYVDAVLAYANRMRRDERVFLAYWGWQVYWRTASGVRRVTGPGLPR